MSRNVGEGTAHNLEERVAALSAALKDRGHVGITCPKSASYIGEEDGPCNCGVDNAEGLLTTHDAELRRPFLELLARVKSLLVSMQEDIPLEDFPPHPLVRDIDAIFASLPEGEHPGSGHGEKGQDDKQRK